MEKFAVDLDKVLDELEFDEDQAENAISGGKFMIPSNNQVVNPLYHMPTFDPMTGSSCVTAPAPCTSSLSTNGQYRIGSGGTFSWRQDAAAQRKSVSGVFSSLNEYLSSSENVPGSVIAPQDDDDDVPWEPPSRPITSDDKKPDLVGSSAADFSFDDTISLPDVAAEAPTPTTEDITSAYDLISHQNNDSVSCDVLTSEPLANISTSSDEPEKSATNMIRFGLTEDLSDSELHQYLEELEAEEEEAMMKASIIRNTFEEAPVEGWCQEDRETCTEESDNQRNLLEELLSSESQENVCSAIVCEEVVPCDTRGEVVSPERRDEVVPCDSQEELASPKRRSENITSDTQEETVSSERGVEVILSDTGEEVVQRDTGEEVVSSNTGEEVVSRNTGEEVVSRNTGEEVVSSDIVEVVSSDIVEVVSSDSREGAASPDSPEVEISSNSMEVLVSSVTREDAISSNGREEGLPDPRCKDVSSSTRECVVSSGSRDTVVSSGSRDTVVSSGSRDTVVSSDDGELEVSPMTVEVISSGSREDVVSSATEQSVSVTLQERGFPEPEETIISSATNFSEEVSSRSSRELEICTSLAEELVLSGESKPDDQTGIVSAEIEEDIAPETSSSTEPQQSLPTKESESHEDRVKSEETSQSTENSVAIGALADSSEEAQKPVDEALASTKVCEADSTGFSERSFEEQRASDLGEEADPDPSQGVTEDDKPTRPSTLELPVGLAGDSVSSNEEPLPYSEPGPAGATPIATRPPPSEPSGQIDSPLQSPDQSEDTSSLASGCDAHGEAASGGNASETPLSPEELRLGRTAPVWIADVQAPTCMLCGLRFTVIRRRHHCRACGYVVCGKCGSARAPLPFMSNAEARVCNECHKILSKVQAAEDGGDGLMESSGSTSLGRAPNPNNPMEYCSTVPPLQQAAGALQQPAPSVMVPVVGVLKREGSTKPRSEAKQVMFSDGIRPGGDLTELDGSSELRLPIRRPGHLPKRAGIPSDVVFERRVGGVAVSALPTIDRATNSYIPDSDGLPPLATKDRGKVTYEKNPNCGEVMALLRDEESPPLRFALNRNLYVIVKIVTLDCCVKRVCWCFTSDGLSCVGQDEVVIVLETRNDDFSVPKDVFLHINYIYHEAATGNTVAEMGHTLAMGHSFLGSDLHAGFLYIRHTTQCVQRLILPPAPFLFGVLIHRWEVPWVRIFPIRLMLRLGAEYRYYPCPLISVRERPSVYGEIGDTVIKFLADFREMAFTLPSVRGLVIHMEDKRVTVLLPRNRYDQVLRALNQSNDHVLAFGANFSEEADAHLVCMQSEGEESKYYTSAIEISYRTRKVTGASFIVFSGGLKASCGMNAKSNIKEDGFVISVTSETLDAIRAALHDMKDYKIACGPIAPQGPVDKNATTATTTNAADGEEVLLKWTKDDCCFNIGVKSEVDGKLLDGVPSLRVHGGVDYPGRSRLIRWTEVFLLQMDEGSGRAGDSMDISRLSEALSKAICMALVRLLDLLTAVGIYTLAVRATIHPDNVGYEAGSSGAHLPPIYMNSLDDALIPVLNKAAANSADGPTVLELVFKIMEI